MLFFLKRFLVHREVLKAELLESSQLLMRLKGKLLLKVQSIHLILKIVVVPFQMEMLKGMETHWFLWKAGIVLFSLWPQKKWKTRIYPLLMIVKVKPLSLCFINYKSQNHLSIKNCSLLKNPQIRSQRYSKNQHFWKEPIKLPLQTLLLMSNLPQKHPGISCLL